MYTQGSPCLYLLLPMKQVMAERKTAPLNLIENTSPFFQMYYHPSLRKTKTQRQQ